MFLIDHNNESFLNKMQYIYSKKGSQTSMSSYPYKNQPTDQKSNNPENFVSLNPIKKEYLLMEKKWQNIEQELQHIVKPFRQKLNELLQNISDENKFYKLLQLMRKNEILSDLSLSINQKFVKQNFALKKDLQKMKQTLGYFSKTHRESRSSSKNNPQTNQKQFNPLAEKIDSTRSIPQNIYLQARLMKEDEFIEWCDKILMKNKIVITDLRRQFTPKKSMFKTQIFKGSHNRSFSTTYETQKDNPNISEKYSMIVKKIQQLSPLTEIKLFQNIKTSLIDDLEAFMRQKVTCPKFCCSLQNQKLIIESMRTTSSKKLFEYSTSRSKNKKQQDIYRNNKTEEYFNRYYKHPSFKIDQIKSVQHTKVEQMNRLQDQYHRMLENRSKLRYGY